MCYKYISYYITVLSHYIYIFSLNLVKMLIYKVIILPFLSRIVQVSCDAVTFTVGTGSKTTT